MARKVSKDPIVEGLSAALGNILSTVIVHAITFGSPDVAETVINQLIASLEEQRNELRSIVEEKAKEKGLL